MPWGEPPPDDSYVCDICGRKGGGGIGIVIGIGTEPSYCMVCWNEKLKREEPPKPTKPTIAERLHALETELAETKARLEALEGKVTGL